MATSATAPSRRDVLRQALGLAGVLASTSLLAACGQAIVATPSGSSASAVAATVASSAARSATSAAATSSATASKSAASASQTTANVIPGAVIAGSKASVAIEYWDWATGWEALLKQLAQEYVTEQPIYRLDLQIPGDYYTKLQVSFAGGSGPDAYRTDSPNAYGLAHRAVLLDLSSVIAQDKQANSDFKGMALPSQQAATYQNKTLAMPFGATITMTMYNVDLVQAAGLTSPGDLDTKWDWSTAADYGAKLTKSSGGQTAVFGFWANPGWEEGWLNYILANGGHFLDPAKNYDECVIGSQVAIDAIQWLADRGLKDKASPTQQDLAKQDGFTTFENGGIAIATLGSWHIPVLRKAKLNFDVTYVPISPTTGKSGSTSNFSMVGVNPSSRVKEDATKFALWHGTATAQKIIGQAEFMPASTAAVQSVYLDPKLGPPHRAALGKILDISQPEPSPDILTLNDVMGIAQTEINAIFQGKETASTGLSKAQDLVNAKLQQAKGG